MCCTSPWLLRELLRALLRGVTEVRARWLLGCAQPTASQSATPARQAGGQAVDSGQLDWNGSWNSRVFEWFIIFLKLPFSSTFS
jgi:hypothetical protein